MIEKKFVAEKKQEFKIKEYIKQRFDFISDVKIERVPVGEKVIIKTSRPELVIGRRGETLMNLTEKLKKEFQLENPHIEVLPVPNAYLDAACVADKIKRELERFGPLSFKIVAYRNLRRIKEAGALGGEIVLSGKLPSERARTWRFRFGYIKKTGNYAKLLVDKAKTVAQTKPGTIGIKVAIMPPTVKLPDKIEIPEKQEQAQEPAQEQTQQQINEQKNQTK